MSFAQITHTIIVWILTLALAALCLWQWILLESANNQNQALNTQIEAMSVDLAGVKARNEQLTQDQLAAQASSSQQQKRLRELEAQLEQTEAGQRTELTQFIQESQAQLKTAQDQNQIATKAIKERDELIKQLKEKQTQLTEQLNERTKQYNELVKKVSG